MTVAAKHVQGNQVVFDREAEHYLNHSLFLPELQLLRLYRTHWPETDMLDLGVGTGRTALTFSLLARSYIGLDYAPQMIERCKARIAESETVRFVVGDATDLSMFADRRFDLVLFSFNGIDCVDHGQRLQVLEEVRKVLKPDGHFFFSSHCLNAFPFRLRLPGKGNVSRLRWAYRCCRMTEIFLKQKLANRHIDVAEARRRGWAVLIDGDHNFQARYYYVLPDCQARQLEEAGFDLVAVYNSDGLPIDWRVPTDDIWLHYLCRPRSS